MESQSTSVLQSKATLLSILESIVGPQASDTSSSNESEYQDDVTDAAVALSSFLGTAYCARLVPRSMMKLGGICTVSSLGEGADYRAEVFQREGQKPFVVKYVKALVPVVNSAGVISVAAAPRLAKVLREMLVAQHALVKANRHILNVDAYGWDDVGVATITPCLISEYAELGTMRQYLVARSQHDPDARYLLWKGVAEGLLALHACDIVHGDVKLDNVLITADHTTSAIVAKVADFGSSLFRHPHVKTQRYWGTAIYNAPEISSQEGSFVTVVLSFDQLKACDVYSFGLLVWENFKDGGLYVPAETLRTGTCSASRDWLTLALHELGQLRQLPVQVRQQIQAALQSTLHSQPMERKTIVELLQSVGLDIDTTSYKPMTLPEPSELAYLDLTLIDSLTNILNPSNFGTDTKATLMPWSVQELLSSAIEQSCSSNNNVKAGLAALNLSVCYYVGLGRERKVDQVLHWLREAARQGCREARVIVQRVHEALGSPCQEVVSLETESDKMESYLSVLKAATQNRPYTTPFYELMQTGVTMFWKLLPSDDHDDILHVFALYGTPEYVSELIRLGYTDHRDKDGQTALLLACRRGHLRIVKLLLKAGSDASIADDNGRTPLHMLVMFPADQVAEVASILLSSSKVDVNATLKLRNVERAPDYWAYLNRSPLEWAVTCGNRAAVRALIEHKADVDAAILVATSLHLDDILRMLLEAPQWTANRKFLSYCFCNLNQSHPFRRMLMHGKDFDEAQLRTVDVLRCAWNTTFIPESVTPEEVPPARIHSKLLRKTIGGFQKRAQSADLRKTPSHDSIEDEIPFGPDEIGPLPAIKMAMENISHQDTDIARALIRLTKVRSGQRPDDAIGSALLGCRGSPFESSNQIVQELINAGFPTNAMNENGLSPVHLAANTGNCIVLKALLQKDPSLVDLRAPGTGTPLQFAVNGINPAPALELLLSHGANPTLTNPGNGETPLGTYIKSGRPYTADKVLSILMELGQSNRFTAVSKGEIWRNALHYAACFASAYEGRGPRATSMLKAVLQHKEMRDLIDLPAYDSYTALLSVCHNVHLASARMLIDAGADIHGKTIHGLDCLDLAMFHTRTAVSRQRAHDSYEKRLPEAFELCLYLARLLKGSAQDMKYTRLHIAVFIGYVEEAMRTAEEDPSQALARDAEGLKPRERLCWSILSQQGGQSAYLATCDQAFAESAFKLQQRLLEWEIYESGRLMKEHETNLTVATPNNAGVGTEK